MNRFRKITAQEGSGFEDPSVQERLKTITDSLLVPDSYKNKIIKQLETDPISAKKQIDEVIRDVEQFDKQYREVQNLFDQIGENYVGYLETMRNDYNVNKYMAAAFFGECWNIYKKKFNNPNVFYSLLMTILHAEDANLPSAKQRLSDLIDKLPSMMGRTSESSFMTLVLKLAIDPNDEETLKQFNDFLINQFIRDKMIGRSDDKLMAANIVDAKNIITEIGRTENERSGIQKRQIEVQKAYNKYIDDIWDTFINKTYSYFTQIKMNYYKIYADDYIKYSIDKDEMKRVRELINGIVRNTFTTNLNPVTNKPSADQQGK
jgi:hypothetical protein